MIFKVEQVKQEIDIPLASGVLLPERVDPLLDDLAEKIASSLLVEPTVVEPEPLLDQDPCILAVGQVDTHLSSPPEIESEHTSVASPVDSLISDHQTNGNIVNDNQQHVLNGTVNDNDTNGTVDKTNGNEPQPETPEEDASGSEEEPSSMADVNKIIPSPDVENSNEDLVVKPTQEGGKKNQNRNSTGADGENVQARGQGNKQRGGGGGGRKNKKRAARNSNK